MLALPSIVRVDGFRDFGPILVTMLAVSFDNPAMTDCTFLVYLPDGRIEEARVHHATLWDQVHNPEDNGPEWQQAQWTRMLPSIMAGFAELGWLLPA